jgi:predicted transcriptional regulator
MSERTTTIALTDDEKKRLDAAARQICGTTEVPYGRVVHLLTSDYVEDETAHATTQ